MIRPLFAAALLVATPAIAQQPKPATGYDRAIAAGYKALNLCSAIFNAGRTDQQVERLELTGIYPEYDAIVPTLTATIDRSKHDVDVPFDPKLPPRHAQWTRFAGCRIAPIGFPLGDVKIPVPPPVVRPAPNDARPWPMGETGAVGRPVAKAGAAMGRAFDGGFGPGTRTTAALVISDGKIVAEHYAPGFDSHVSQRTWSVAKSLRAHSSATPRCSVRSIPAALPRCRNGIVRRAIRARRSRSTISCGWRADFTAPPPEIEPTRFILAARRSMSRPSPGRSKRSPARDFVTPTTTSCWRLWRPDRRCKSVAGKSADPNALFDTLGMTRTIAETDWHGNFVLSSQVWSTARDLARLGMLYLNDGVWNGERIFPAGWVKYVTTPSGPQPDGAFGYGATFWLMNKSPGVPADTFAGFGNRGQYVVIVPSRKIVIVRRGEDPAGARFDIAKFTADVLAALK